MRTRGASGGDVTYRGCGTAGPIPGTCPSVVGSTPTQPAVPLNPYTRAQQSTNRPVSVNRNKQDKEGDKLTDKDLHASARGYESPIHLRLCSRTSSHEGRELR